MNTFYHFEGRIFESLEALEIVMKNYTYKKYDIINTDKNFDDFESEFEKYRQEDNSILDSIDFAK